MVAALVSIVIELATADSHEIAYVNYFYKFLIF